MKFEAVIFDCDGVLVNSEPICNQVLAEMITEQGLPCTTAQSIDAYMGLPMSQCIRLIESQLGKKLPDQFRRDFKNRSRHNLRKYLQPIDNVENVIKSLRCPIAVASSGDYEKIKLSLETTGLFHYFAGNIFSAADVTKAKPHPEIYLLAANNLGVQAGNCAVIEDSLPGVCAGVAAGMTVFGFATLTAATSLRNAGARVFNNMRELNQLLN